MSTGETKIDPRDPAGFPVFRIEFPATQLHQIDLTNPDFRKFVKETKILPFSVFFLTDDEVRIKATFIREDDKLFARIHWGTIEEVVVEANNQDFGDISQFVGYDPAIKWNPYNKVVQDHRNGKIIYDLTNIERLKRGLPYPWKPEYAKEEVGQPPMD